MNITLAWLGAEAAVGAESEGHVTVARALEACSFRIIEHVRIEACCREHEDHPFTLVSGWPWKSGSRVTVRYRSYDGLS